MNYINIKGVFVLVVLIIAAVSFSLFVNNSGIPPYISYPITIISCIALGIVGGKYVE